MRVLVLGAGGFIGRHAVADLLARGHEVVGVARRIDDLAAAFPEARFLACDLARALPPLAGIDAVVSLAGVLSGSEMQAVHVDMPRALYRACRETGVRRVVLISAISARPDVATDYARSKLAGEQVLRDSGLDWTILRPSLVYAKGSYGGTSLLRGLAGLPGMLPRPGDGSYAFTPIHVDDLAHAISVACESDALAGATLEPVGSETLTLAALLARYRRWLGFGPARVLPVPLPLLRLLAWVGDRLRLGPISSNSLAQLLAGNAGDPARFATAVGFAPRSLDAALAAEPAEVQDRWHARLFFIAPLLRASLIVMWIASALLGLGYGHEETLQVLAFLGLPAALAFPLQAGTALIDLGIAALLMLDRRGRMALLAQLVVVLGYTLVLSLALPTLWLDPFGALLKNLPILAAILVNAVLTDQR